MSDLANGVVLDDLDLNGSGCGQSGRRWDALARWLEKSRDAWKRKYMDLKAEVHRMNVRVADVLKSRERWKQRAEDSEAQIAQLQAELERLQAWLSEPPDAPIKTQPASSQPGAPKHLAHA